MLPVTLKLLSNGGITWIACLCTWLKPILLLIWVHSKFWRLFYHKNIRAALWKAKFDAMYHTLQLLSTLSSRMCFVIVLVREVLLCKRICSSNSASLFTRWMYLLQWRMSCNLFRMGIIFSQSVCLLVFACDHYLWHVIP